MIKFFIIFLSVFSLFSCKPVESNLVKKAPEQPFTCLSSQSNCLLDTELGQFTIEFSGAVDKGRLKTELPFQIQLQFSSSDKSHQLDRVSSYLEGKTMFMGKVPVFFEASATENIMNANTLLASCSEEVMTWRLFLTIEIVANNEVQKQSLFIDFDSIRL